jgi:hypothetical protein
LQPSPMWDRLTRSYPRAVAGKRVAREDGFTEDFTCSGGFDRRFQRPDETETELNPG